MPLSKCSWFLTLGRLLALGILLLLFASLSLVAGFSVKLRLYLCHLFCRILMTILGGRLRQDTRMDLQGKIVVANHLSWLDAIALYACAPMKFMTSTDVQAQGFVGSVCRLAACAFVDRSGRNLRGELCQLEKVLQKGHSLVFFPEATSSCGPVLPFKSAFFELAHGSRSVIQPAALEYSLCGASVVELYYYGDQEFLPHLWKVLRLKSWTLQIQWGPGLTWEQFPDRKALSLKAREWIVQSLRA